MSEPALPLEPRESRERQELRERQESRERRARVGGSGSAGATEALRSMDPADLPAGVWKASEMPSPGPVAHRVTPGPDSPLAPRWDLDEITGRLTEISGLGGNACLTLAISMVLDAQRRSETVAWITDAGSSFFPLDAAAAGVDLEALAVVRVPDTDDVPRAADRLARSGGFGLLVLDLGEKARMPTPLQARLRGLADRHEMGVLCLTDKRGSASSLGSLVSLRGEACVRRKGRGRFACELQVIKDKHRGPGWSHTEICRGPDGLY